MRILHIIPQFPYFGGRTVIGGHASSLLGLALAQAQSGMDVTILSHVHDRAGSFQIEDSVQVHNPFENARPGTVRYGLQFSAEAARWAGTRRGEFDIVHSHSGFADYFIASRKVKAATALPVVHTLYCPILPGGRWHVPILRGWFRRAARRLDALAAMSQNVADSMVAYGLGEVTVVPPPVDLLRFCPSDDHGAVRAELGLGADDVAVLFVGNAKPQKNLAGLLQAFHEVMTKHPAARLVITTELKQSSSDEQLNLLRQQMIDLGLEDRIVQLGIVDDMPRLIQACDIVAAPFLDTRGPSDYFMVVLEAMACGKPTIVSAVGGMPEVVNNENGRLINPQDNQTLSAALDEMLADANLRRTAGQQARSYTEAHFDPARIVARYRELYERIAS